MPLASAKSSKINGFFQNATGFLSNANSMLGAGGNTLQNLSGITNTISNFSQKPKNNNDDDEKPKTNWLLIVGACVLGYMLLKPKRR